MTPGQIISLITAAGPALTNRGLLDPAGNFVKQPFMLEVEDAALVAQDVETALKADGVVVSAPIDKAMQSLPAILSIVATIIG
jgi:hypothetical protein